MSDIFITRDEQRFGPFPKEEIINLVENGHFAWNDLAWRQGMDDWAPLLDVYSEAGGSPGTPRAAPVDDEEDKDPGFFRQLPGAFIYPFKDSTGWIVLAAGAVILTSLTIVLFVPVLGWVAGAILFGYYLAYLFAVIRETAAGEEGVADFPSLYDLWEDILLPFVQFLFTLIGCMAPGIAAAIVLFEGPEEWAWAPGALVYLGIFYFPMALLGTVIFNSVLSGLNPLVVIPSIYRVFLRYLIIVGLLIGLYLGNEILNTVLHETFGIIAAIPVVGFVSFYFGIVQARILGLLYSTSEDHLRWFEH